jgi:hypothetical protein
MNLLVYTSIYSNGVLHAAEKTVHVVIIPADKGMFHGALKGKDPLLADQSERYIANGLIELPKSSIKKTSNITLKNAEGKNIPLIIESTSLYSEFDDGYNSLRAAFFISAAEAEKGIFTLEWGDSVHARNTEIEKLNVYIDDKTRYRTFRMGDNNSGSRESSDYSATLEVIVDDHSDKYYLWYLLPIILIFTLLGIRKAVRG